MSVANVDNYIREQHKNNMEIVYLEAVLMDNNELLHFGKSLGFVSDYQKGLIKDGACKLTRGSEPVVCIKGLQKAKKGWDAA